MLNKIYISLLLALFGGLALTGQNIRTATPENLVGMWVQTFPDLDTTTHWICGDFSYPTLTFSADHKVIYSSIPIDRAMLRDPMLWEYDAETNILNISPLEKRSSDGSPYGPSYDYIVKKLDSETLILQMTNLQDNGYDARGITYKKLPKKD
ncbi:MAG: hypothetical protein V4635_04585 [Bacteroidota bacterium]